VDETARRQESYLVRCEWGAQSAALADAAGATVVIDVLSFTTSVSVMVERGTDVYPAPWLGERSLSLAREHNAALAVGRREVSDQSPYSLSPAALMRASPPERLVLPSPNGSAVASVARGVVVAACLRNAAAVGEWLRGAGYGSDRPVTIVPAGERWPDGSLRPALEDLVGAGAVLAALSAKTEDMSPEAAAARATVSGLGPSVVEAVRSCVSARELIVAGFGDDVEIALALDDSDAIPVMTDGCFRSAAPRV
jgi:2-phosphosulfolactate phosphatase